MAKEMQLLEPGKSPRNRKLGKRQAPKNSSKKSNVMPSLQGLKKVKIDKKMKKLFCKRAQEHSSDGEEYEVAVAAAMGTRSLAYITNKNNEDDRESEEPSEDEGAAGGKKVLKSNVTDMNNHISEDEGEDYGEIHSGITKFTKGCRVFKMAFKNIINKSVSDDSLGPVLSGHKKIIVEKLAEVEAERKIKGEAKKEKHMLAENGHVKPASYLDSHEKFLISVATKGVVKLFNAVNKAQTAQKGLDASRSKDAKESKL